MQSERAGGHLARSSAFVLPISLHKQHDVFQKILKCTQKIGKSDKPQPSHRELEFGDCFLGRLTHHACKSRHRQKVTLHRENHWTRLSQMVEVN